MHYNELCNSIDGCGPHESELGVWNSSPHQLFSVTDGRQSSIAFLSSRHPSQSQRFHEHQSRYWKQSKCISSEADFHSEDSRNITECLPTVVFNGITISGTYIPRCSHEAKMLLYLSNWHGLESKRQGMSASQRDLPLPRVSLWVELVDCVGVP